MAYTGILLRGDTYDAITADPPINREVVMAGEFLGATTIGGSIYYLNLAELVKIGTPDAQGNFTPGFKTSELPITYNGGYIQRYDTYMGVDGTYTWRYEPLANIEVASTTELKISGVSMNTPNLKFFSYKPTIDALSTTEITVSYTTGTKAVVYNATTSTQLGELTASGATLTFGAAQNSGDVIYVWTVDADDNKSLQVKGTIA